MKRNLDLLREILLNIEQSAEGWSPNHELNLPEYPSEEVSYHIHLLIDAGFIEATIADHLGHRPIFLIHALTWSGHEFLDAARNPGIWEKAKAMSGSLGSMSVNVLISYLEAKIKERLGITA